MVAQSLCVWMKPDFSLPEMQVKGCVVFWKSWAFFYLFFFFFPLFASNFRTVFEPLREAGVWGTGSHLRERKRTS